MDVLVGGGPRAAANVGVADDDDVHASVVRTRSAAFCKWDVRARVCVTGAARV